MQQGTMLLVVFCVGMILVVEARTTPVVVGCDGVLGSGLVKDKCGVCGGDNTACEVYSGDYTREDLAVGYHRAFKIPKGAMYINITEMAKSRNYLALEDSSGERRINGNWRIDIPGNFTVGGTVFEYKRDAKAKVGEQFLAMGPTTEDLYVVLIYQTSNPGIHYEWVIRKPAAEQDVDTEVAANEEPHQAQTQSTPVRQPTFSRDRPVTFNPIRQSLVPERQGFSRQTLAPGTTSNPKTGKKKGKKKNKKNKRPKTTSKPKQSGTTTKPKESGTANNQQPVAPGSTNSRQPVAAETTNNRQPVVSETADNRQPETARTPNNRQPVASGTTNSRQPETTGTTNNRQPETARTSDNRQPVASETTNDRQEETRTSNNRQSVPSETNNRQSVPSETNNRQTVESGTTNNQRPVSAGTTNNRQVGTTNNRQPEETETTNNRQPVTTTNRQPVSTVTANDRPKSSINNRQQEIENTNNKQTVPATNSRQPVESGAANNGQTDSLSGATNNRQPVSSSNNRQPVSASNPVRTSTPGGTPPRTRITTTTTFYNRQGVKHTSSLSQGRTGVAFVGEDNPGADTRQESPKTYTQSSVPKTTTVDANRNPADLNREPEVSGGDPEAQEANVDPSGGREPQAARIPETVGQIDQARGTSQVSQRGPIFNRNSQQNFGRNPPNPVPGSPFNPQSQDRGNNPQNPSNFNPQNPRPGSPVIPRPGSPLNPRPGSPVNPRPDSPINQRPDSPFRTGSGRPLETGGGIGSGQPSVVSPYTPGIYRPNHGSQSRYPLTQGATESRTIPGSQISGGGGHSPIPTGLNPGSLPGNQQQPPQGGQFDRQQPGRPFAGQPYSGQPIARQPQPGQPISGQPINGQPLAGHPLARQPLPGQPIGGQQQPGQPRLGQPLGGQPSVGGQPRPGQPLSQPQPGQPLGQGFQPFAGQPRPGLPLGGQGSQPYGGQPRPGQPLGGQGGQPRPGQTFGGQQPIGVQPRPGQPLGQPQPGQPFGGQPQPGQPLGGHTFGGQPRPGQPLGGQGGQPRPGQPFGGQGGQTFGGQGGQPFGGQPRPGQPIGQPRPGQPLGGQGGQPFGGQPLLGGQPRPGQPLGGQGGQPLGGAPRQPLNRPPIGGQPLPGQPLVPQQTIPGQPLVPGQTQGVVNPYSGNFRPQYPGSGTPGAGSPFGGYPSQPGVGNGRTPVQGGPVTQYSGDQFGRGGLPDSVAAPDDSGRPSVLNPYTNFGAGLKENTRGKPQSAPSVSSSNPHGYQQLTGPSVPVVGYDNQDPTQQQLPNVPVQGGAEGQGNRLFNRLQYMWYETGDTECSVTCGGGLQTKIVQCVQEGSFTPVEESLCDTNFRPNPIPRTCNQEPCPPEWDTTEWGECSRTCGEGRQLRNIVCKQTYSQTLRTRVDSDRCDPTTKPNNVQNCKLQSCAAWKAGEWGECSARCGEGRRTRPVKCVDERSEELDEELCQDLPKPTTTDTCDMGPCVAKWFASDWSDLCSSECDGGERTRDVVCATEGYSAILDDSECSSDQKPRDTKMCNNMPCGAKWVASMWGQCSAECGEGTQTREVLCVSSTEPYTILPAENCPMGDKPELSQSCVLKDCQGKWFKSDWSECSKTCGGGHRTRDAKCLGTSSLEPSTECSIDDRPEERQSCNIQQCSLAPPPDDDCRDKFSYCTVVARARLCTYSYYKTSCCFSCHGQQR